jgi:hypothetical protein
MSIQVDLGALKMTKWSEYALRFLFGGGITVVTAVLADRYGPEFGGLFLAFPALFVASSTLIEKHERERKEKSGIAKTLRGRQAAALDARGVTMGSIGLIGFALVVWKLLPIWNGALLAALVVWLIISILIWRFSKSSRSEMRISAIIGSNSLRLPMKHRKSQDLIEIEGLRCSRRRELWYGLEFVQP